MGSRHSCSRVRIHSNLAPHVPFTDGYRGAGIGIDYWSPLWPYPVNVQLTLDDQQAVIVDLQDHSAPEATGGSANVQSKSVWGQHSLDNGQHTLVISMVDNGQYIVVDALEYAFYPWLLICIVLTVIFHRYDDGTEATSSSSSTASTTAAASTSTSNNGIHTTPAINVPAIAAGAAVGGLVLMGLIACVAFCCWRRRQRHLRVAGGSRAEALDGAGFTGMTQLPIIAPRNSGPGASSLGQAAYDPWTAHDIPPTQKPYHAYSASSVSTQSAQYLPPGALSPSPSMSTRHASDASRNGSSTLPSILELQSVSSAPPPRPFYVMNAQHSATSLQLSQHSGQPILPPSHPAENPPFVTGGESEIAGTSLLPAIVSSVRDKQARELNRYTSPDSPSRMFSPPPAYS